MTSEDPDRSGGSRTLRERAETRVRAEPVDVGAMSEQDIRRLIYDLQVHEVALQMQNEQLREARMELEERNMALEHARQALAEARDRVRHLHDLAPVGYLTFDGEAIIREANLTFAELLGVDRDGLVGSKLSRFIVRESQDDFYFHRRDLASGKEQRRCELRLRLTDDSALWVGVVTLPVVEPGTGERLYRAALSDISARKEAEAQLRLQLRLTERISACAAEAIFVTDRQSRISRVNAEAERLFGYTDGELLGRTLHQRLHCSDGSAKPERDEDCTLCRPLTPGEELRHYETRLFRKDGEALEVSCSKSALEVDGEPFGAVVVVHDLTARKRVEHQLEAASRRKDEFLGTLAHELRNPLAPISNALGLLELTAPPDERARSALEMIERQVNHLVRLIDDLVDVSRLTRGKLSLRRERVDLCDLLESALETVRPQPGCKALALKLDLPGEPVELDADPVRLQQVFVNLLHNACKFTPGGGEVRLSAERVGREAVVRVCDTGVGIASEDLPKLFSLFTQVGEQMRKTAAGLGVGLSLARGLVELHGGRISAHSAGPGEGAELVVHVPLAEQPAPEALPAQEEPAPEHSARRVLLADDQPDIVDSLRLLLEASGHEVVTARDGVEAVAAAERHRPELVLLDIGMPRLDGYAACRRIRAAPWGRGMRLIALTGWGQDVDRRRSAEAGFDRHLVKPVSPAALLQVLAEPGPKRPAGVP